MMRMRETHYKIMWLITVPISALIFAFKNPKSGVFCPMATSQKPHWFWDFCPHHRQVHRVQMGGGLFLAKRPGFNNNVPSYRPSLTSRECVPWGGGMRNSSETYLREWEHAFLWGAYNVRHTFPVVRILVWGTHNRRCVFNEVRKTWGTYFLSEDAQTDKNRLYCFLF